LKPDAHQIAGDIRDRVERDGAAWFFSSRQQALWDQLRQGSCIAADIYQHLLQSVFLPRLKEDVETSGPAIPFWQTTDGVLQEADAGTLARAYEVLLSLNLEIDMSNSRFRLSDRRGQRKATGSFYTPDAVVERLLDTALEPVLDAITRSCSDDEVVKNLLSLKICDPACGAGYILIAAARRISSRLANVGEGRRAPTEVVSKCVFGVDIDPIAVALCRDGLRELADVDKLNSLLDHIMIGDSLRDEGVAKASFDVVVGNPPWVSFSGRQAKPVDDVASLVNRFPEIAPWPCTHSAFMLHANQITRSTGRWGFVLPLQASFQDGYRQVRRAVNTSGRTVRVYDVGESAFPGVSQAAGIFAAEPTKAVDPSTFSSRSIWQPSNVPVGIGAPYAEDGLPAGVFRHLASLPKMPLQAFSDPGVHSGNIAKFLFEDIDSTAATDESWAPVREGKDIGAYFCGAPRRRLNVTPVVSDGQYCRIGKGQRYVETPVLIRQTANRPIAARHRQPTYFRNSLLACAGIDGVPHEVLLAVLNSSLIAKWYRRNARDASQRSFPQIKVRQLRQIPMFRVQRLGGGSGLQARLADLVHQAEQTVGRAQQQHPDETLMREIELVVLQLYGIGDEHLEAICFV